jgi:hypothetical protein
MIQNAANLRKLSCLITFIMLAFGLTVARAQTQNLGLDGGTLSWTVTERTGNCGAVASFPLYIYNSFNFTYGGTNYPLSGQTAYYGPVSPASYAGCDGSEPGPIQISLSAFGSNCYIAFTSESTAGTGSATASGCTFTPLGVQGYVDLKYLVVGVTYAPPGPSGNTWVQYSNSTYVGNTMSLTNSFQSTFTKSISIQRGFSIFGWAGGNISTSYSTSNSQESTNSQSVTTSINVQSGETTYGTGNYFSPVNNDYDIIWVWLNPVTVFTVTSNTVTWNGYGYNTADQNGMDIVGIPLGYLNGDFGPISSWDNYTLLERAWAVNTESFPAGQSAGLTSTDLANIAAYDPFSVSTYGPDYIGYVPPSTTSNGRFTMSTCTSGSSFPYSQGSPSVNASIYTCNLTYTSLTTLANSITNTTSQTFSTDIGLSAQFLAQFNLLLQNSNTLTWTTSAQQSITNGTTLANSLSVQGPPCGNTPPSLTCVPEYNASGYQPLQFDVYQDNLYGTFMFAPIHYY